jgi:hypothetical protein
LCIFHAIRMSSWRLHHVLSHAVPPTYRLLTTFTPFVEGHPLRLPGSCWASHAAPTPHSLTHLNTRRKRPQTAKLPRARKLRAVYIQLFHPLHPPLTPISPISTAPTRTTSTYPQYTKSLLDITMSDALHFEPDMFSSRDTPSAPSASHTSKPDDDFTTISPSSARTPTRTPSSAPSRNSCTSSTRSRKW